MSSDAYKRDGYRRAKLRKAVIHRDGPDLHCWMCRKPIDLTLKYPHPYSLSIDHYVPLSKGGDPWLLDNCLPACLTHNQSRGNRTYVPKAQTTTTPAPRSRAW